MTGAAYILIIALSITGLFSAAFAAIALYDRRYISAWWFAATYVMGIAYGVSEFLLPYFSNLQLGAFLGHVLFLVALTLLNIGLTWHYNVKTPMAALACIFIVSVGISSVIHGMPRDSFTRLMLYQAPYCAMQALGVYIILLAPKRRTLDNVLAGFLVISSLHYLLKPFLAVAFGGTGPSPASYLTTTYAMVSQSLGTVLVVATGLLLLASLAFDIIQQITLRSETDALSGLLNRRGFELRLAELARESAEKHLPLTLVTCDLDHFKTVNDTYGHTAGDRLIVLFADILRRSTRPDHVAARIGGEEFAVILPATNLHAARLLAENVRSVYSASRPQDIAGDLRISASFGVAELAEGERPQSLFARADAALYDAKRAGRDCVRPSLFVCPTEEKSGSC